MLWEVYTRTRAYTGKTPANIMYLATARKCHLELELPASAPAYYKVISTHCCTLLLLCLLHRHLHELLVLQPDAWE